MMGPTRGTVVIGDLCFVWSKKVFHFVEDVV